MRTLEPRRGHCYNFPAVTLKAQPLAPVRFGVFEADLTAGELRRRGRRIALQEKPFRVLATLLSRPGELVTKEELKEEVWPDATIELDLALSAAVSKIRRVLGDATESPRFVETVPKRGYRFLGPVDFRVDRAPAIAVLPFRNLSSNEDQEYFSDGLTDALITALAQISGLKVISRTSVMLYKDAAKSAPEIAAELGVSAIVEGSVQREGERTLVNVQLIDARNDDHLWAQSYTRTITAVLSLQGEIARSIAAEVQVRLAPHERDRFPTGHWTQSEAVEAYLRGKYQAARLTPDGLRAALSYFQKCLESDPDSSLAHSGLGMVYMWSTIIVTMHPLEAGRRGYHEAQRAVELDSQSSHAYCCLGLHEHFYRWDWRKAESAFRTAIALSPNDAEARLSLGLVLSSVGRTEEAAESVETALELDPLNLMHHHMAGVNSMQSARYEDAITRLREVVARAPGMQVSQLTIWCALNALGRIEEAYEAAVQSWACVDDDQMVKALQDGYAAGGYREAMRRGGDVLAARFAHTYVPIYITAMHYDFAGEVDKALDWIERGYRERDHALSYIHRKPYSDRLLTHPRYQVIFEKLRYPRSALLPVWRADRKGSPELAPKRSSRTVAP